MPNVNIKVIGARKLVRGMNKVAKRISDTKSANLAAAIEYEKWIKKNFQAKGANHDDKSLTWKQLADSTKKAKRKIGRSPNAILIGKTRNLMLRWDITANKRFAIIRSGVRYSSYHEHGTKYIPQRKIFAKRKQLRKIVTPVYQLWMKNAIKF